MPRTAMPLGCLGVVIDIRSVITVARVMLKPPLQTDEQIGSWLGASPNHTMNFIAPGRQPANEGPTPTATWCRPCSPASGRSPPPLADQPPIAALTAA